MLSIFLFNLGLDFIMTNLCSNSSSFKHCYGCKIFIFGTEYCRIINYVRKQNVFFVSLTVHHELTIY